MLTIETSVVRICLAIRIRRKVNHITLDKRIKQTEFIEEIKNYLDYKIIIENFDFRYWKIRYKWKKDLI